MFHSQSKPLTAHISNKYYGIISPHQQFNSSYLTSHVIKHFLVAYFDLRLSICFKFDHCFNKTKNPQNNTMHVLFFGFLELS